MMFIYTMVGLHNYEVKANGIKGRVEAISNITIENSL